MFPSLFVTFLRAEGKLIGNVKVVIVWTINILTYGEQQVVIVGEVYDGPYRVPLAFIDVGLA